jgi:3-hydroxyanthranilate 3,4-dioxygenase
MAATMLAPFDFRHWIDSHRHLLKPPVGNKLLFPVDDFVIMIVGGPNARSDFHVDPGQEFFFQVEGDMVLKTVQAGKILDIPIRQGEMFLLPANLPHSPQRFPDTVGLVIERRRVAGEQDGLQWYCENCNHKLYEEFFELTNIETQFPPVFQRYYDSVEHRTCRHCGTVAPVPDSRGKSG